MKFKSYFATLLICISLNGFALTIDEIPWGSEFTFSNNIIGDAYDVNHQWSPSRKKKYTNALNFAQNQLIERIKQKCADCIIKPIFRSNGTFADQYRIIYPDGYLIDVSLDIGVIETQAKPANRSEYEKLSTRFQNDIFDSADEVGLFPDTFMSGGHIHIGFAFFEDKPILLRNFLVDLTNHFELFEGILDLNIKNAPSLRTEGEEKINKLREIIEQFDRGELKYKKKIVTTAYELAEVYFKLIQKENRYFAINLARFGAGNQATIEIRGIRTQATFLEFLQEIKLFESRLRYLERLTEQGVLIPVENYVDESKNGIGQKKFKKILVQKFYNFVVESGLEWEPYRKLIYMSDLRRKTIKPICRQLF